MIVSKNGLSLIKQYEGCELEAYQDIAGVWTIGYGHTGPEVREGMRLSKGEAEDILRADLASREDAVRRMTSAPLGANAFAALVSLVYNIGAEAFRYSTVRKRINAGDTDERVAEAWGWWSKATVGGVLTTVPGLVKRRSAEIALYLEPDDDGETLASPGEGVVAAPGKSGDLQPQPPPADYVLDITPPVGLAARAGGASAAGLLHLIRRLFKRRMESDAAR